jgi:hypothetical protein
MRMLTNTNTVGWIQEETLAKICPREYVSYKLERAKVSKLTGVFLYKCFDEYDHIDTNDKLYEDYRFLIDKTDFERCYSELKKEFTKKTGFMINLKGPVVDARLFQDYVRNIIKDVREFADPHKDNWVINIGDLNKMAEVKARIVTYTY